MSVRRNFIALSMAAATLLAVGPAAQAQTTPGFHTAGGGGVGRTPPPKTLPGNGTPGTPIGGGGTGPQNPGTQPLPQTPTGPFTPGENGPKGPMTPGGTINAPPTSGPFSNNGKKSGGGFFGAIRSFFGTVTNSISRVFNLVWTINGLHHMFGWMHSSKPTSPVGPMANAGGGLNMGSNPGRNESTTPGAPGTPVTMRESIDRPVRVMDTRRSVPTLGDATNVNSRTGSGVDAAVPGAVGVRRANKFLSR